MPRRDHAGIAPALAGSDLAVALDKHDVVAVLLQLIGGRDADDPTPEHYDAHEASAVHAPPVPAAPMPG